MVPVCGSHQSTFGESSAENGSGGTEQDGTGRDLI